MKWKCVLLTLPLVLAACSAVPPERDHSTQKHISRDLAEAVSTNQSPRDDGAAMRTEVFQALMQPSFQSLVPKTSPLVANPKFDLVVSDAPIGQVLAGLAKGSVYSILLKPATTAGPEQRVSFNLKNITLFEALDAMRDVYGYDYTVDKQRILVQPAQLETRLFHIDYILGQRRGVSDLQVVGGASSGGTTGAGASNFASVQASGLSTSVKSDIWGEAEDALRTLLGCSIPKDAASTGGSETSTAKSGSGVSRADVSYPGTTEPGDRQRGVDGCSQGRALTINQMSGTILVRGMPSELRTVTRLLKSMQISISRQVIIEAKIIDVELNKDSQQGINWGVFRNGLHSFSVGANAANIGNTAVGQVGGAIGGVTLGGLLGTAAQSTAAALGTGIAIQARNFAALINFLESQGTVHVLSSPRIATLNNQKAILKVGTEEPFVTNITGGTSSVQTGTSTVVTQPSLVYQPFFSGIALDVTPQIDQENNITLHVHSMVNKVIEKSKIALPDQSTLVPFAVNTMNETDSVVKARDGHVIVIGGLMTERNSDSRSGVTGARDLPLVGGLFKQGDQSVIKRELVIMLKPTVVKDESDWSQDLSSTRDRIQSMGIQR